MQRQVTNDGTDRSQLTHAANETKTMLGAEKLDAVADRGYFNSEEIRVCEEAGITVTLPKPMTSNSKAWDASASRTSAIWLTRMFTFDPAGEKLAYSFTTRDKGMVLRRYRTTACHNRRHINPAAPK